MRYQANMAVRLRVSSELLLIDSVDEEAAIAFCRRIGTAGPAGECRAGLTRAGNAAGAFGASPAMLQDRIARVEAGKLWDAPAARSHQGQDLHSLRRHPACARGTMTLHSGSQR